MAKLRIKQSVAVLTAALLLAAPFHFQAQAAEPPVTLNDLLNPEHSIIPSSLLGGEDAQESVQAAGAGILGGNRGSSHTGASVDPEIDTSSSDRINVIIELSSDPVSILRYASGLSNSKFSESAAEQTVKKQQSAFQSSVSAKGIDMKVNYTYDTVLNGMEVTVSASQIPKLSQISGVKSISLNSRYYPIPITESPLAGFDTGYDYDIDPLKQIGADKAWASGLTGKGIKVGVIDTGVDYDHPDLKNAYKGGYDSFYQDNDPYEEPYTVFDFAGTSHGTHVAGTIVGRAENPTSEVVQKGIAYEADLYAYKVLGKTFNEETGLYDVSGSSAQVIDGIEHAVKDGMDVINLSLGSDMEKDPDSPDSIAVNNAVLAGVVAVVANGNAGANGKYYYSMGSPASSQLAISVAAATSVSTHYSGEFSAMFTNPEAADAEAQALMETEPVLTEPEVSEPGATVSEDTYSPGEPAVTPEVQENAESAEDDAAADAVTDSVYSIDAMAWGLNEPDFHDILGSGPLDAVYVGLGNYSDYQAAGDVSGKVALVSRGNLTFVDKVKIAKEFGVKAVVMFNGNSLSGTSDADLSEHIQGRDGKIGAVGFLGDDYSHIPTFDLSGVEGRALARLILAHPGEKVQFTFGDDFPLTVLPGDTIADFSSRGPNSDGNYSIKPDISAPGVNILSTYPEYASEYGNPDYPTLEEPDYDEAYHRASGTSMASPHIAGLAVLMKQAHPDWTPLDIRAALANTADVLSSSGGTQYDVYSQGAGRADVADALITPAVVESMDPVTIYDEYMNPTEMPGESSSLSFGAVDPGAEPLTKPLQLKNLSGQSVTYSASVVMHPSVTSDPSDPISTPDVSKITMTLGGLGPDSTVTAAPGSSFAFTLSAQAESEAVHGVYEGEVRLQSPGLPALHLPFVIHVGEDVDDNDFGLKNAAITGTRVTPDQPVDISATLQNDSVNLMVVEVYALDEGYLGRMADLYDLDSETGLLKPIAPGKITFENLDGSYTDGSADAYGNLLIQHLPDGEYKLAIIGVQYDDNFELVDSHLLFQTLYVDNSDSAVSVPTPTPSAGDGGESASPSPTPSPDNGTGSGGSGGGGVIPAAPTPSPSAQASGTPEVLAAVLEQGQSLTALKGTAKAADGQTAVTVSDGELQTALAGAGQKPSVFSVTAATGSASQGASLQLTAAQLQLLKSAPDGSSLAFTWNDASVSVPLTAITGLAAEAGFMLSVAPDADSKALFAKAHPEADILGTPYAFDAYSVANGVKTRLQPAPDETVHRSFLLDSSADLSQAGALYTENGQVYAVPAKFKKTQDGTTIVTVSRPGFSTYAAASRHTAFSDIQTSWAKEEIRTLADRFLLNGNTKDLFSPKAPVTRAQFASMLANALGLDKTAGGGPFSDIKGAEWYAQDVAAAYRAGLVTGSGGAFRPNDEITRQDLTVMLARALKLLDIQKGSGAAAKPYADAASFSAYAKDSIQAVSEAGLMQGAAQQGQFFFNPAELTTREAAAKVLYQLLTLAGRI